MSSDTTPSQSFRSGYVALVGYPNVGKSTLLNALLNHPLSIVSGLPQTTRDSILGILNSNQAQIILVDTPGWLSPKDVLQAHMKKSVVRALHDDADLLVWIIDPRKPENWNSDFYQKCLSANKPLLIVINKVDLLDEKEKKAFHEKISQLFNGQSCLWISAKKKEGVEDVLNWVSGHLPLNPPYYPTDQLSDRWERFYVAELIRQKIFEKYREEVPHASAVVIKEFREKPNHKDFISAIVYVETEGQKKILIGQKGRGIKDLSSASRLAIESFLGRPVFLEIQIKIKKAWRKDGAFISNMIDNQ